MGPRETSVLQVPVTGTWVRDCEQQVYGKSDEEVF